MPYFSRRQLLLAGSSLGFGAFVFKQGLRYPRMGFEPENPATKVVSTLVQLELKEAFHASSLLRQKARNKLTLAGVYQIVMLLNSL